MPVRETKPRRSPFLAPWRVLRAHDRLAVCGAIGAAAGLAIPQAIDRAEVAIDWLPTEFALVTRALIGWDIAVLLYLLTAARIILRATHESIRRRAQLSDEGRSAVLFLTATTTFVAIGAIIAELGQSKMLFADEKGAHIALAVTTVVASWTFMHLIFAFHYAHEYYSEEAHASDSASPSRGGLNFPNTPAPHYIDFLYFSYVIGVACQTADVNICSRPMRAVALMHGVVSFFFNTTILALMVNIASQFV
ncbi:DUF1345 domain-containing protein [Methylocystis sp. JR02]|uniref:DUF1345 domain-containing protein n=1 Tax=Methylocystis sp. JR02 TaxID=3046284 RepID=UPI0024B8A0A6|nr:DUF1345 domain-containing protein [Methylocystis sp. JR02]MDJ0448906.1 DUF1345 domain-containing protein [Methylocystis sp. JR02]